MPARRDGSLRSSPAIVNSGMGARETASPPFTIEEIRSDASETTLASARALLLEYGRFVVAQPGAARFCFGTLEKEAARLPLSYLEQSGGCLIAYVQDLPAGFVAWRALPETIAPQAWELKRLWVRPQARGLDLGRALTQPVLDRAVAAGRKARFISIPLQQPWPQPIVFILNLGFRTLRPL